MQTYKPNEKDAQALLTAAQSIKAGNTAMSTGKKQVEAGKAFIDQWLKESRSCDLSAQPIGEVINIEGVLIVRIDKQNRFDEKAFTFAQPELALQFKKEFPTVKFLIA